jgi:hypothetical protein
MPDDGRAALDAIEAALDEQEEKGFARWDAMNDVATAAGLNWMDATQQDIVGAIEQTRARVAELEAQLAAQQWRPVTADWPPRNQRVVISAPGASWADVARKQHDGEEYVWQLKNGHVLDFESATVAIPLPPAPAPQEPTP